MRTSGPIPIVRPMSLQNLRLVRDADDDPLPPCPAVTNGVPVHFMGTERRRVEGEVTGFVYYADPTRRTIEVDPRDLAGILTLRAFVRGD